MQINIQTNGVIITARQKALIEKKISKMKKYLPQDPIVIDVILSDETGPEKGGRDQTVRISTTVGKEKIFIEEIDDRLARSFACALNRFERQLSRYHHKVASSGEHSTGGRFEKIWKVVKRK